MELPVKRMLLPLVFLVSVSVALNTAAINFPLRYHIDEPKKVGFVLRGSPDFRQPILMLQLGKLANQFPKPQSEQDVIFRCRLLVACFGTGVVLLTLYLASKVMTPPFAWFSAFLAGVSPLLVVHSHYFKEDILLTFCSLVTIVCMLQYEKKPDLRMAVLCGASIGAATAAHYKGLLLFLIFLAIPILSSRERSLRTHLEKCIPCGLAAGFVFVLINFPMFRDPNTFLGGVLFQAQHVVQGHTITIMPWDYACSFHLVSSLIPGMGGLAILLMLLGTGSGILRWKDSPFVLKLMICYGAIFYFVVELAPLKTSPNYERYVVSLVPAVAILGAFALQTLWTRYQERLIRGVVVGVAFLALAFPFVDSVRLVLHFNQDTRAAAEEWLQERDDEFLSESHSSTRPGIRYIVEESLPSLKSRGVRYLVTSSFAYERFFLGSTLWTRQSPIVYEFKTKYENLFSEYPYVEFAPTYRSYAFSNPTIRIVDISSSQGPSNHVP